MRLLPVWFLLAACGGDKDDTDTDTDTDADADADADADTDTDTDADTDADADADTDTDADTDPTTTGTCGGLTSPIDPDVWYDALIAKFCDAWDSGCAYPWGGATGSGGWTATTPATCPVSAYYGYGLPGNCRLDEAAACACLDATWSCAGDEIELAPSCMQAVRCTYGGSGSWTGTSPPGSGGWTTTWTSGSGSWTDPGTGGSGDGTDTDTSTTTTPIDTGP